MFTDNNQSVSVYFVTVEWMETKANSLNAKMESSNSFSSTRYLRMRVISLLRKKQDTVEFSMLFYFLLTDKMLHKEITFPNPAIVIIFV